MTRRQYGGLATLVHRAALALAVVSLLAASPAEAKRKRRKKRSKAIPALTAEGKPNVQAAAVIVLDTKNGAEYFAKDADVPRHIASTGKIFIAMVVRKKGIELEATTEINRVDAAGARGGARTRLELRHKFKNIDLLRAMLVASDNRACTALGRAVGLSPSQLVAEMNQVAKDLGLTNTTFTDPSGLRGNTSTARDMALALAAAMKDPVLATILSTRAVEVRSIHSRPRRIHYRNTNRALHSQRVPVTGGKTGFTNAAGYCLLITARIGGRSLTMAFLGTRGKLTRFGDFNRVSKWFARAGPGAATAAQVGGGNSKPL